MTKDDKAQGSGGSSSKLDSTTQRVRDYFRERVYGHLPQGSMDQNYPQQDIHTRSRTEPQARNISSQNDTFSAVHQVSRERRRIERWRKPNPTTERALPGTLISSQISGRAHDLTPELLVPRLRRVGKLGRRRSADRISSSSGSLSTLIEEELPLKEMRKRRDAIVSGELERVVPPPLSPASPRSPMGPPLTWATLSGPSNIPFPSPYELSSRHLLPLSPPRQKHTAISNLTTSADLLDAHRRSALSNLTSSADLLDATRRNITSTIRRGAEKTVQSIVHRADGDDYPSDDESFYCIGEDDNHGFHIPQIISAEPSPVSSSSSSTDNSRTSSELSRARRLSLTSTVPWTAVLPPECRLCRKRNPAGLGGLCLNCEQEFKRPITRYVDSSSCDEEEIKPTPPLKIVRIATGSQPTPDRTPEQPQPQPEPQPPKVPIKDVKVDVEERGRKLRVLTAESRARVADAPRHMSQVALVGGVGDGVGSLRTKGRYGEGTEDEEMPRLRYEEWQSAALRAAYDNASDSSLFDEVLREEKTMKEEAVEEKVAEEKTVEEKTETVPKLKRGSNNRKKGARLSSCSSRMKEEGRTPMIAHEESEKEEDIWTPKRDTTFYSFYDEVLEDAKERPARRKGNRRG